MELGVAAGSDEGHRHPQLDRPNAINFRDVTPPGRVVTERVVEAAMNGAGRGVDTVEPLKAVS